MIEEYLPKYGISWLGCAKGGMPADFLKET